VSAPDGLKNFGKAERHRCAMSGKVVKLPEAILRTDAIRAARREFISRNRSSGPMLVGLALLTTRSDSKSIQVTFRRFLVDFISNTSEICNTCRKTSDRCCNDFERLFSQ
jgi:hypothetical protein